MPRLVVVHGPQNSGKIARVWEVAASDPTMHIVHRDTLRVGFGRRVHEDTLTALMADVTFRFLVAGHSVVTAMPDMTEKDRIMWSRLASEASASVEWIDTSEQVAA